MEAASFLTLPLFFESLFTTESSQPHQAKQGALPMDGPSEEDGQQTHYPPESEVCCQVHGCANAIPTKVYYTRHKICSFHASLPGLTLDGQSVRWCQQCARFQPVEDFDGSRKTCWKALAQHNERRRKRGATGGRGSSRTRTSPKSSSCTESPGALGTGEGSPWTADGAAGEGLAAPGGSSGAEQTRVVPGRGRRAAAAAALAHFGACTDYEDESDDETVQDGACRSRVGGKPRKLGRRSGGGDDISSGMAGQLSADFELQEVLGLHARGASAAQAPGSSGGGEAPGAEGSTRAPSLPWGSEALRGLSEVSLPTGLGPAGKQQPEPRPNAASPLPAGLHAEQQQQGQQQGQQVKVEREDGPWQLQGSVAAVGDSFAGMERALSTSQPSLDQVDQESLVRLSLKLFNVSPDQLVPGVKEQVLALVTQDPAFVDSFVRPGCTHLTVTTIVSPAERELLRTTGAAGVAEQILRRSGWGAVELQQAGQTWSRDMLVQLDADVAVVRAGKVAAVVGAEAAAPKLVAARPIAMLASGYPSGGPAAGGAPDSSLPPAGPRGIKEGFISLWGYNIGGSHDMVVCRQQGRVLDVEIIARGKLPPNTLPSLPSQDHTPEWVLVRPLGVSVGLLQFEVQCGGVLSAAVSMVALPNMAAVVEARQAQRVLAGIWDGRYFSQHLGLVLEAAGLWAPAGPYGIATHVADSASSLQVGRGERPSPSPSASFGPQTPQLHPLLAKLASNLLGLARQHGWASLAALLEELTGQDGEAPAASVAPTAAAAAAVLEPELPGPESKPVAQQGQQQQGQVEAGDEPCHMGKELASDSAPLDANTPLLSSEVASHAARPSSHADSTSTSAAAAVQTAAGWDSEIRGWSSNSESDREDDEGPSGSSSPRHDDEDDSDDDSLVSPPQEGVTAARKWHSQVLEQLARGCPKLPSMALLPKGHVMASMAVVASVVALRVLLGEA